MAHNMSKHTPERHIEILQHDIAYWYDRDQDMDETEEEHVREMIMEGYSSGELCDGNENRGWWRIEKH